jgi:hypothetical protein
VQFGGRQFFWWAFPRPNGDYWFETAIMFRDLFGYSNEAVYAEAGDLDENARPVTTILAVDTWRKDTLMIPLATIQPVLGGQHWRETGSGHVWFELQYPRDPSLSGLQNSPLFHALLDILSSVTYLNPAAKVFSYPGYLSQRGLQNLVQVTSHDDKYAFARVAATSEYYECAVIAYSLLPGLVPLFIGLEYPYPLILPYDALQFEGKMMDFVRATKSLVLSWTEQLLQLAPVLLTATDDGSDLRSQANACPQYAMAEADKAQARVRGHAAKPRQTSSSSCHPPSSSASSPSPSSPPLPSPSLLPLLLPPLPPLLPLPSLLPLPPLPTLM